MSLKRRQKAEAAAQEAVELAALADGSLEPERRAALETRVAESPELVERLVEQQRAVALAQSVAAEVEAPASLRERIATQRHSRHRPVAHRVALIGAAASVAAVAVVAIAPVLDSDTSGQRLHAVLTATNLAPGAAGEATLTKTSSGWRVELDVTGLPRLDGARFYEAWLRSPVGVLAPIGTFNEGRHVTLWAGVSPEDFTTLTITRESADGDQASSGQKVLVGAVDVRR